VSKYNIGDRVKFAKDAAGLSDLESDLQESLADRSISGTAYDKIWKAIEGGKTFVVTEVEEDTYGLKVEGTKTSIGSMIYEEDLQPA
jgi:hypothetical protein